MNNSITSIADILKKFNPVEDKYISREFQSYGVHLAQQLGDEERIPLYIKLAKTVPRAILEKALSFVTDANAKSKPRLFMWKMKELKQGIDTPAFGKSVVKKAPVPVKKKKVVPVKPAEPVNMALF